MERFYALIPIGVAVLLGWLLKPSWWAFAMIVGGTLFAWNWLWGDRRLLVVGNGLTFMASGAALVVVRYALAVNLGLSLAEFVQTARGLSRRESRLYLMPECGIGIFLYGLIIFTLAVTNMRDSERQKW